MTAFKREARYRQALWREGRGLASGSHSNSKRGIALGGKATIPRGSKLDTASADAGQNFLSEPIRHAVQVRLATREAHETLDETRLRGDLLSSMPMCFNLFGELHQDATKARQAAQLLMPAAGDGEVEVRFEWSPGRRNDRYTGDGTAFDAAFLINSSLSSTVIGIETKYHEHAAREASSARAGQEDRYRKIASDSGVFSPGWEDLILETPLRQIWRDHLLLLSMLQPLGGWTDGRYVLVYPERNTSFARAASAYREVLRDDATFAALTLEELLDADVLHTPATAELFRERYLW